MKVTVLRTNGTREEHDLTGSKAENFAACHRLNLRDGRVMLVDDNGWVTERVEEPSQYGTCIKLRPIAARHPVNVEATKLYHAICKPGTTHQIVGDVVIVYDGDL